MSWFRLCVSGLLCCACLHALAAQSRAPHVPGKKTLESHQEAVALMEAGNIDAAIKLLKDVIGYDRKFAPAYNTLAEAYIRLKSPRHRARAEHLIEKALSLDPGNTEYMLHLARLRQAQGVDLAAQEEFRKVLEANADNPDALYEVGMFHMREMVKYEDIWSKFIDGHTHVVIYDGTEYWDSVNRGERDKASQAFQKILARNPEHRNAYVQLAVLAWYGNNYKGMLPHLDAILEQNSSDNEALCLKGVACVRLKRYPEALTVFNKALKDMNPELRKVYESSSLLTETIMMPEDRLAAVQKSDPDFWKAVDPMYLTPYNERQLEHYARITEANLRFDVPDNKHSTGGIAMPGWQTDRGYVFIKYGKPFSLNTVHFSIFMCFAISSQ